MDDNELKLISEISKNGDASQRELSRRSNMSLGLVNIVLRRLIEKGYMKIKQLDGRKVQYILTPTGFTEKVNKSKQYLERTVSNVTIIKEAIKEKILDRYSKGDRCFAVIGNGDLSHIVDIAVSQSGKTDIKVEHATSASEVSLESPFYLYTDGALYAAKQDVNGKSSRSIDLETVLSEILI